MSLLKNILRAIGWTVAGIFGAIMTVVVWLYTLAWLFKAPLVVLAVGFIGVIVWLTVKFQKNDKANIAQAEKNGQP